MFDKISPFMSTTMCRYASLFDSPASLLEHILFVIGNGYGLRDGMIVDEKGVRIDELEEPTDSEWKSIIAECHAKEAKWHASRLDRYVRTLGEEEGHRVADEEFKEELKKYFPLRILNKHLSEEALYDSIVDRDRAKDLMSYSFTRPYPLSKDYSKIFQLTDETPAWFLQLSLNFCKAWIRFLEREVVRGNFWVPLSKRHLTQEEKDQNALADEIIDEILVEEGKDPSKIVIEETEVDYADQKWTELHLSMLRECSENLSELLRNKFKPKQKVVVAHQDPNWSYGGCSQEEIGAKGKVVAFNPKWHDFLNLGKVAVSFKEKELGYEPSDRGDITIFLWPSQLEIRK